MTAPYTAGKGRSRLPINITMEHHYQVDLFIAATDSQLHEINNRFNKQMVDLLSLSSTLDPKDTYKSFDVDKICLLVSKHYPEDFSTQEKCRLSFELEHFYLDVQRNPKLQNVSTLTQLIKVLANTRKATTSYPLVDRLIRRILTIPVSTTTCERAFSVMSIVKTTLWNQMKDDFLSDILVAYIEKWI
ncbi:uncharacterized protein LOC110712102 [Chenopodium quinoa]|uniref:uncharacterized protein LOC110712102 n=1 Tax=Chenopodium quinoa TaxID=63459 RepID=UPI000B776F07|nr:uncharacterized protein LOC110712102 [Chenopodium quinoa]